MDPAPTRRKCSKPSAAAPVSGLFLASPAASAPCEIKDLEGFEAGLAVIALGPPEGRQAQGPVAWHKPFQGNRMQEVVFPTPSAGGHCGMRIVPRHQIARIRMHMAGGAGSFVRLADEQAEQGRFDMPTQIKGLNRHIGAVRGTAKFNRGLVLAVHPAGAGVIATPPGEARPENDRQLTIMQTTGPRPGFDAAARGRAYPGARRDLQERQWFSSYRCADDLSAKRIPGTPHCSFQSVTDGAIT